MFTSGIRKGDSWMRRDILMGRICRGLVPNLRADRRHDPSLDNPTLRVAIWIVPADEERQIALEAQAVMAGEGA
jgi:acetate kinase